MYCKFLFVIDLQDGLATIFFIKITKITVSSLSLFFCVRSTVGIQTASDDEGEKYERAFILQLLGSDGSSSGKEVLLSQFSLLICIVGRSCPSVVLWNTCFLGYAFLNVNIWTVWHVIKWCKWMTNGLIDIISMYVTLTNWIFGLLRWLI